MAPRNNDTSTSYSKNKFSVENDGEADVTNIVPCILHKKHKVVKLVKSQLQKILEEGIRCDTGICYAEEDDGRNSRTLGARRHLELSRERERNRFGRKSNYIGYCLFPMTLALILLILLMVWISAGPLSNSMAHTPIAAMSFVRIDGLCSLEKKYLLRWSKPDY